MLNNRAQAPSHRYTSAWILEGAAGSSVEVADDEDAAGEGGAGLALHIAMAALSAMRLRGGLTSRDRADAAFPASLAGFGVG